MTSPRVSVLMPVHNAERFLVTAVDSVLSQSMRELELIAIDDGSTDSSIEILRSYDDPRIRVIALSHTGMAGALNVGLSEASATVVARMDADDLSLPGRLERQLEVLRTNPSVAVVGSWYQLIDAEDRPGPVVATLQTATEVRNDLFVRCPLGHGTVMARREALISAGGYDGRRWPADDYHLWHRLASGHDLVNVPEVLYLYRVHGSNSVSTTDPMVPVALEVRDEIWSAKGPARLTIRQALADVSRAKEAAPACRPLLLRSVTRQHIAVIAEALRRRRWAAALGLLPGTLVFLATWLRQDSPIAEKMARKRMR